MLSSRRYYRIFLLLLAIAIPFSLAWIFSEKPPDWEPVEVEMGERELAQQSPAKIGERENVDITIDYLDQTTWSQRIHYPGASFIKVHIRKLDLQPGDRLVVSNTEHTHVHSYPDSGYTTGEEEGIWALSVIGDTALIELIRGSDRETSADSEFYAKASAGAPLSKLGVEIDQYTRGYPEFLSDLRSPDSTCGTNERTDVACYENTFPDEFDKSHAVARITIVNGGALCTAWRVSPDNFVMTNEHCISSQSDLNGVEFWFNYQRLNCETGSPEVPTIVPGDTFLTDDYVLDFALVTLDDFPDIEHFGYLELEPRTPILGEEIYIAQHGAGNPKEFGIESDFNPPNYLCQIDDAIRDGRGTNTDTGYFCDTTGGSSGSPVLARSSDKVIGLHHFGTGGAACGGTVMNGGVRIDLIYPLISGYFPPDFTIEAAPGSQEVCAPEPALYGVEVDALFGFTDPVDLEVEGLPSGSSAAFSDDPVIPPASSTLTITTAGVLAGTYDLSVVGSGPSDVHTRTVTMTIRTQDPISPTLLSPADGEDGVDVYPTFSWEVVEQTTSYDIEVAADINFTDIVYEDNVEGTSAQSDLVLTQMSTYYWRVRAVNACSIGDWSQTFSFTTEDVPPILLVDDDDDDPDIQSEYRLVLDYLVGLDGYDIHDNLLVGSEPTTEELNNYDQVIWFTGNDGGGSAGPDATGETSLASWLDGAGCLLVSSQDYFSDRGMSSLITGYLGVGSASSDVGQSVVTGEGSVFGGLGPYNLSYSFPDRSDLINPDSVSGSAFIGDHGNAAVYKDAGGYRTSFFSFPWEALPSEANRQVTMAAFLSWCDSTTAPAIEVTPTALSSTLLPNATSTEAFDITNNGDGFLIWQISEDQNGACSSAEDISWIDLPNAEGTTIPGSVSPVDVIFNSDGLASGTYTGTLCVASNDDLSPLVEIQLEMIVESVYVFLPSLEN